MPNCILTCTHCGVSSAKELIGDFRRGDDGPYEGPETFDLYQVYKCLQCKNPLLTYERVHDWGDGEDELRPDIILPQKDNMHAYSRLHGWQRDLECMKLTVEDARRCVSEDREDSDGPPPKVGAAVVVNGETIYARRGEIKAGDHAEFTLLEGKCADATLFGTTVYTTLEPCTTRGTGKVPCVDRLIGRRVNRVVIGMLDPDEKIRGRGILALRKANIQVDLYPPELMSELEEINRKFIQHREQTAKVPRELDECWEFREGHPWRTQVMKVLNNLRVGAYFAKPKAGTLEFRLTLYQSGKIQRINPKGGSLSQTGKNAVLLGLNELTLPKPPSKRKSPTEINYTFVYQNGAVH